MIKYKTEINKRKNNPSVYTAPKKNEVGKNKRKNITKLTDEWFLGKINFKYLLKIIKPNKNEKLEIIKPVRSWLFKKRGDKNLISIG